ncbi:putative toxin-antitoxin system toxin component, PIN family [Haliscomenobacter sp.]|uniref:putative toxin-antitoxin system toxin component, PIN family n=1 Tax=Haliscomenobacter sp. TaxID=2717303 RepID=UPI0035930BC7
MRIVIDTNLWISALFSYSLRQRLESIIGNEQIAILASDELLNEVKEVAQRPNLQKYVKPDLAALFLEVLSRRVDLIEVNSEVQVCRDPNDDFLLALCKDGKADLLITGDKDLLIIGAFENTKIVNLSSFEGILSG